MAKLPNYSAYPSTARKVVSIYFDSLSVFQKISILHSLNMIIRCILNIRPGKKVLRSTLPPFPSREGLPYHRLWHVFDVCLEPTCYVFLTSEHLHTQCHHTENVLCARRDTDNTTQQFLQATSILYLDHVLQTHLQCSYKDF